MFAAWDQWSANPLADLKGRFRIGTESVGLG
jgi:hypothetical protein